jgi:spectinomycin phosphotransferase/16S rRNA (guanine(1405)-N(7))-methyltransferase
VLTPPAELDTDALAAALTRHWGVVAATAEYLPAGFGSHHWKIADPGGGAWFVTVDDLRAGREAGETRVQAVDRLRRALRTARALFDGGAAFVVAPIPTAGGDVVVLVGDRYAASLFPFVEGESFEFADDGHPGAVLELIGVVHTAPASVRLDAVVDDLGVPNRWFLENPPDGAATGPYATRAAELLTEHADGLRAALARYDAMAAAADRGRDVLTHGEPHPGNTLRTKDGWRLLDWDTARLAPPERDLWLLGADFSGYTAATGIVPVPELLEMFRLRWALTDVAVDAARFTRPHDGDADDETAWAILSSTVAAICS